ncbi:MAG: YggS family pyridoxal phosphate-dependent enzyme [Anaerolineales bacterium]
MSAAERYLQTLEAVQAAAHRANRDPDSVRLMVVTKTHSPEVIAPVLAAGARLLGENYPEQALPKMAALAEFGAAWHCIGNVQSRKVGLLPGNFAMLHALEREKIALRLARACADADVTLPVLLECNVSGEASKAGWQAWDESAWHTLADVLAPVMLLPRVPVQGLMTVPPFNQDPRPFFNRLRRLRDFLAARFPQADLRELSMGMSADYAAAIAEGATIVRVGTAIFGSRA